MIKVWKYNRRGCKIFCTNVRKQTHSTKMCTLELALPPSNFSAFQNFGRNAIHEDHQDTRSRFKRSTLPTCCLIRLWYVCTGFLMINQTVQVPAVKPAETPSDRNASYWNSVDIPAKQPLVTPVHTLNKINQLYLADYVPFVADSLVQNKVETQLSLSHLLSIEMLKARLTTSQLSMSHLFLMIHRWPNDQVNIAEQIQNLGSIPLQKGSATVVKATWHNLVNLRKRSHCKCNCTKTVTSEERIHAKYWLTSRETKRDQLACIFECKVTADDRIVQCSRSLYEWLHVYEH